VLRCSAAVLIDALLCKGLVLIPFFADKAILISDR
jgi:hypothetical protein